MRKWLPLLAAAALAALQPNLAGARVPLHQIAFGTPTVVDPIHTWGEPDVALNPVSGDYYSSGPTGTGTQRSMWEQSVDGGHTFRELAPNGSPNALEGTNAPPGGGDTDIAFDHTGKQYFADLYALTCFRMAVADADGENIQQNVFPGGCAGQPPADRQWFAVWDRASGPIVYLEYNDVGATQDPSYDLNNVNGVANNGSAAQWVKSTDGLNYTPAGSGESCCPDGYPSIYQPTGQVFQAGSDDNGDLALNIGTPDGNGNLTFLDAGADQSQLITAVPAAWMCAHGDPNDLFPVSSLDSAGNLYVLFVTEPTGKSCALTGPESTNSYPTDPTRQQIWVAAASRASGWRQWTPPYPVSDGRAATGDAVNVMPWIKAGAPGLADGVWYGSGAGADGKVVDASTNDGQSWNVFMSRLQFPVDQAGQITGRPPQPSLVQVTPHPMHYGDICELGTFCISQQGNRNLADFFNLTLDQDGRAVIVYDDTSNMLLQPGAPSNAQAADHAGAPVVTIAHQTSGPGVFSRQRFALPPAGPSNAPVEGMADPSGDALYPVVGGANVPGLDLTASSLATDGTNLVVTMRAADLSALQATESSVQAPFLSYVTRWVMHDPTGPRDAIYYAEMEVDPSGAPAFYAGQAQSVDLCSVSACFPHVITYPEAGPGANTVRGTLDTKNGLITITVPLADVGSPTGASELQEVGAYAFAQAHPHAATTNAQAQLDDVPLEVDGVCCYNFVPQPAVAVPDLPAPLPLGLLGAGLLAGLAPALLRRRRPRRAA